MNTLTVRENHEDASWFNMPKGIRFGKASNFHRYIRKTPGLRWLDTNYRGKKEEWDKRGQERPSDEHSRLRKYNCIGTVCLLLLSLLLLGNMILLVILLHDRVSPVFLCSDTLSTVLLWAVIAMWFCVLESKRIDTEWTTSDFQLKVIQLAHFFDATHDNLDLLMGNGFDNITGQVPKHISESCEVRLNNLANLIAKIESILNDVPGSDKLSVKKELVNPVKLSSFKEELKEQVNLFIELGILPTGAQVRTYHQRAEVEVKKLLEEIQRRASGSAELAAR